MKLAVTYQDGNVFQHFGRTEQFKIYEIENSEILNTTVINTNGTGHEALADFLAAEDVSALICGGMGEGAQAALSAAGISIFSGAEGNADEAVQAFLAGKLENAGVNCDHHHEEEHECGCGGGCGDEGCGCGDDEEGCGGCGGGCGGHYEPDFEGPNVGKNVRVNYEGTLNDGTKFDSSYDRGQTLDFVCGAGMMIHGFDKAVATMKVGETVNIHLAPSEAYGEKDPAAILHLEIAQLPGSEALNVGEHVYLTNAAGRPFPVTVTEKDDTYITLDANHEMAGKELNFKIELVEVQD